MNKASERIHAALLRFRAESPDVGTQIKPDEPTQPGRPLIVVEERNLAALLRLSVKGNADRSDRHLAATSLVSEHRHAEHQDVPDCWRPAVFTRP